MLLSEATDTRYDIVKILGQGGSATVYLARHIALNEMRVLKILHHDMMMDAKRRAKFKLEAQVAAHLKHAAIVQIYDVTQSATKLQIEMEYIDGMSLRQHLERRKNFPLSVSLAFVYAVLEGLEHAHRARMILDNTVFDGVIHRDLKPENIMVRKNGQPVVCDFGVAKVGADLMTQTQHISGSIAYMAPERLRGELSTRSIDVFALGVMLFELHKGYRPFPGNNKTQVLENILRWNIVDLETDWRGSDASVLQIIRKALARDVKDRYQDASQMLAALRPIYKLYHGEATPAAVLSDYLTRGQFTTAEFRALMPDEAPWKSRLGIGVAALAVLGIGYGAYTLWPVSETAAPKAATAPHPAGNSSSHGNIPATGSPSVTGPSGVTGAEKRAPQGNLAESEAAIRKLPPAQQQRAYYELAKSCLREKHDPGNAMLLVNKALDLSFHPTIALLKVEILQDQDMLNLSEAELARIEPWLPKMAQGNQAQYHWLLAQLELQRVKDGSQPARALARAALKQYLALQPKGADENLKKAKELLASVQ